MHVSKIYKEDEQNSIYKELLEAHNQSSDSQEKAPSYGSVLCDPYYSKATWLVCAIAFFNQMSGVNLISIYSTTLF